LQEEMARFNFAQQLPYQQLQGFLSSVYGTPMGASNIPQAQTNQFGQVLGGAVLGGQVGSLFGRTEANPFGYGNYGAILGGLSGLIGP
jgi:outer membrane lipoprotein SlyB